MAVAENDRMCRKFELISIIFGFFYVFLKLLQNKYRDFGPILEQLFNIILCLCTCMVSGQILPK